MFTGNTCNDTNELNNFFTVTMTINGHSVGMQIDTGAAVSVMSVVTLNSCGNKEMTLP